MFEPIEVDGLININTAGKSSNSYRCKVKTIAGERLNALLPADMVNPVDLIPGTMVKVTYIDNMAVYTFSSEIIAVNRDTPSTVTLGSPVNLTRIQRRNFVRLDIKLKVISNKLDENMGQSETFLATTVDISGGGILFGCDAPLTVGQVLEATIFLNEGQTVTAVGRVVRIVENSASSKHRFSVGFEFTVIRENERDKIVKFIFNRQRELRIKGLL